MLHSKQYNTSSSSTCAEHNGDDDVVLKASVDVDEVTVHKPHFLDYEAISISELEEDFNHALALNSECKSEDPIATANSIAGEHLKLDKKFEHDGEVSDYELVASGYTKKEFTQDDNTLHMTAKQRTVDRLLEQKDAFKSFGKSKHFLDENPIPPDYMLDREMHEHKSLDRNFERHHEYETHSSPSLNRKSSLDRLLRSSREKLKEPCYTLARFLDNEEKQSSISKALSPMIPKGQAWTEIYDSRCDRFHLTAPTATVSEIDQLGPKVECVYSLLSMLGSNNTLEMSKKFLELSKTPETCAALRRSGCIPLLVQITNSDAEESVRKYAGMALHNVVHSHPDEKAGRREAKVLRLLDQLTEYCSFLKTLLQSGGEAIADDSDRHPLAAISSLMKVSFDEEHRHAMCELGALQVIPSLVHLDHAVHGPKPEEQCCNSLRRYALMALTNLTFGDENNKALLCSQKLFMEALVVQLDSAPDDLLQVTASVLRNLSWRADNNMKAVLNEIGTVTALTRAAMKNKSENTLKAILSALWNLSAHCSRNKAEFCAVDGALAFLVDMLTYEGPSKTLKIIENAGGILRNVSSHIAVRAHYREILRERKCLAILLQQLKSESLTVVSNSCGTLWNLSARCPIDQKFLWDNGAIPMLRSLIHSKHAMISEGSSSALKNLLNFRPSVQSQTQNHDPIARSMGLKKLPTLTARKQKTLEQELGAKEHSETFDNLDVGPDISNDISNFETNLEKNNLRSPLVKSLEATGTTAVRFTRSSGPSKSESRDSVLSTKSDPTYENFSRLHSEKNGDRNEHSVTYSKKDVFALTPAEHTKELPIDYSVQFHEKITQASFEECDDNGKNNTNVPDSESSNYTTYQETDIDQPTDFSLRYAENQVESDVDISPPDAEIVASMCSGLRGSEGHEKQLNRGNEILLILEDSVKCYQTEGTPYVISNAASVTDLHQNKAYSVGVENKHNSTAPLKKTRKLTQSSPAVSFGSGTYTPEKPVNYCEEGTPGYFSRYDSLSSLNESPKSPAGNTTQAEVYKKDSNTTTGGAKNALSDPTAPFAKDNTKMVFPKSPDPRSNSVNINSAQETPLMFSRHSSMDSLADEDVCPGDDKSSVVSDFSRIASGVISPSDIPDSPTQSMPQSPRRNSGSAQVATAYSFPLPIARTGVRGSLDYKQPPRLRSVFEDDLNTFHVENTPAQFSTATSLSNLNISEEETPTNPCRQGKGKTSSSEDTVLTAENIRLESSTISEGDGESEVNNDDLLLASCINMGMSRTAVAQLIKNDPEATTPGINTSSLLPAELPREYCTEDTPALLSKVGSNTNLSSMSLNSNLENKAILLEMDASGPASGGNINLNRCSLNLSDEVSSNASEAETNGQSSNILQQCIQQGMKKNANAATNNTAINQRDPVEEMRCGGNISSIYLPVSDETSKFLVEDTPCNFSVVSALSNLTVGSSLVGPAIKIEEHHIDPAAETNENNADGSNNKPGVAVNSVSGVGQSGPDDSLSSLSIDSEDDTNLLSQAIAAGYNRPKSNLGFSSPSTNNKRSTSLSMSQPISVNLAPSTSSLTSAETSRYNHRRRPHVKHYSNDSYSSVDSSDSNDNQSKSLLELCIITGMNKRQHSSNKSNEKDNTIRKAGRAETLSTAPATNLKRFGSSTNPFQFPPHHHIQAAHNPTQLDRKRKDEQILLECINTGISNKICAGSRPASEHTKPHKSVKQSDALASSTVPKNVQTTSAAALEPYHQKAAATTSQSANSTAAPDVDTNFVNPLNTSHFNKDDVIGDQGNLSVEQEQSPVPVSTTSTRIAEIGPGNKSGTGCNSSSNACLQNSISIRYAVSENSSIRDVSSVLPNTEDTPPVEKHKDPDLMLKSVERLTQEFVSSAEYLRSNNSGCNSAEDHKQFVKHNLPESVNSTSNNTWNEDTSPNGISFPSVSVSVPLVGPFIGDDNGDEDETTEAENVEMHDFTKGTQWNGIHRYSAAEILDDANGLNPHKQPNSIETNTETLVPKDCSHSKQELQETEEAPASNGIHFIVGGEVQNSPSTHSSLLANYSMDNSGMIAMEARNLAENLTNRDDNSELTYSMKSLDLDNVRPPSGMESLNMSGYYDESCKANNTCMQSSSGQHIYKLQTPQLLARSPKLTRKLLPIGLVARRAVGQLHGALSSSAESVHSSCVLLDNIKPPSLMDELLDSMISVDSLQSEVVDCDSLATTVAVSNYETAAAGVDFDENTITLQSTYDNVLPVDKDEDSSINSGNLFPSDLEYSSAESTPKKVTANSTACGKRPLTPKQKRRISKDRFKTYTIAVEKVLDQVEQQRDSKATTEDENIEIEDFIATDNCLPDAIIISTSLTLGAKNKAGSGEDFVELGCQHEYNSVEYDQNSETESCHDREINSHSSSSPNGAQVNSHGGNKDLRPRIVNPGDADYKNANSNQQASSQQICAIRGRKKPAYVSPYRMQNTRTATSRKTSAPFRKIQTNSNTPLSGKQSQKKSNNSSPKKVAAPLERQGTFVKQEPTTNVVVPVVDSATVQPSSPKRASKLPTKKHISSATKATFVGTLRSATNVATNPKPSPLRKPSTTPQRSNTNASLKVAAKHNAFSSRISSTTPASRSNSNLNCGSSSTVSTPTNSAGKVFQARSRIAGIWKSDDEVKKKQQAISTAASTSSPKRNCTSSPQKTNSKTLSTRLKKKSECSPGGSATEYTNNTSKLLKRQVSPYNESKSTPSKIAVSNAKFSDTRKDSLSSRK